MNVAVRKPATQTEAGALKLQAAQLRGKIIEMSHAAQAAHLASSLSCADIVTAAYWHVLNVNPGRPDDPLRDRFILSKGHAAAALYAALAMKGYFPIEELDTYCKDGGRLAEHPPANLLPGVEAATGSLGHGLPLGAVGPDQGRSVPGVRPALRWREQRGIGVGGGDVCGRAEVGQRLCHR